MPLERDREGLGRYLSMRIRESEGSRGELEHFNIDGAVRETVPVN